MTAATHPATAPAAEVEITTIKIDPAATPITAKLDRLTASEMCNKLGDLAGILITPADDNLFNDPAFQTGVFSAEWDKQTHSECVREICESMNLHATPDRSPTNGPGIRLERNPDRAPVSTDQIALFRVTQLVHDASRSYVTGQHQGDLLRIYIDSIIEPKFRGWAWIANPHFTKAVDDQGHAMVDAKIPDAPRGVPFGSASPLVALLEYPAHPGGHIAELTGTIPIEVATEIATITFHNPVNHKGEMSTQVGTDRLTLNSLERDNGGWFHLKLTLDRGEKTSDEDWTVAGEPFQRFAERVALIGPKGATVQNGGWGHFDAKQAHAELNFSPREAGDQPTDFQVQLPANFATVKTRFEFKDLPMP